MEPSTRKALAFERYVRRFPPIVRYPYIAVVVPLRETRVTVVVAGVISLASAAVLTYLKLGYPSIGLSWMLIAGVPLLILVFGFSLGVFTAGDQLRRDLKGTGVRHDVERQRERFRPARRSARWAQPFKCSMFPFILMGFGPVLALLGILGPHAEDGPIWVGIVMLVLACPMLLFGAGSSYGLWLRWLLWHLSRRRGRARVLRYALREHPYDPQSRWSRFKWWCYGGRHEELMAVQKTLRRRSCSE